MLSKLRLIIAICLWRFALSDSSLLNFLPMLIQAGQEKYFLSEASSRAGNHISNDFLVSMAQMRLAIYVINRCCDVKALAHSPLTVANEAANGNCGFCVDIGKRLIFSSVNVASRLRGNIREKRWGPRPMVILPRGITLRR